MRQRYRNASVLAQGVCRVGYTCMQACTRIVQTCRGRGRESEREGRERERERERARASERERERASERESERERERERERSTHLVCGGDGEQGRPGLNSTSGNSVQP